jgi:hypothetical protein
MVCDLGHAIRDRDEGTESQELTQFRVAGNAAPRSGNDGGSDESGRLRQVVHSQAERELS